jgi:hypothetical protein
MNTDKLQVNLAIMQEMQRERRAESETEFATQTHIVK